ncbi:MAG: hypothetical protein K0S09_1913 [Sphingobacteriaceae bacterium]|jgi:hypothetical protein|nr:hypothetical protein [Sphingobacteriaceae bacterium]
MPDFRALAYKSFNNFVMVNRTLTKHFKDSNPALLLGYFISEDQFHREQGTLDKHGYFYCKADKLMDKFGFTASVQRGILDKLVQEDLIEVYLKRIDASESLSEVRHIKINYGAIHDLVYSIPKPPVIETLPSHFLPMKYTIVNFIKRRGGSFVPTSKDEEILRVAELHGLCPEILEQNLAERKFKIKSKRITLKYILSAFISNFEKFQRTSSDQEKGSFSLVMS